MSPTYRTPPIRLEQFARSSRSHPIHQSIQQDFSSRHSTVPQSALHKISPIWMLSASRPARKLPLISRRTDEHCFTAFFVNYSPIHAVRPQPDHLWPARRYGRWRFSFSSNELRCGSRLQELITGLALNRIILLTLTDLNRLYDCIPSVRLGTLLDRLFASGSFAGAGDGACFHLRADRWSHWRFEGLTHVSSLYRFRGSFRDSLLLTIISLVADIVLRTLWHSWSLIRRTNFDSIRIAFNDFLNGIICSTAVRWTYFDSVRIAINDFLDRNSCSTAAGFT